MSRYADLSVEVGHLYLDTMTEESIRRSAREAQLWIPALLKQKEWNGRCISICVLIDNYHPFQRGKDAYTEVSAPEAIVKIFGEGGVVVDHVVWEKACADDVAVLKDLIEAEPRQGAGSRVGEIQQTIYDKTRGWLSNGIVSRDHVVGDSSGLLQHRAPTPRADSDPRYTHAISLDVEMWSHKDDHVEWSCPMLAAWWQLVRLGALHQLNGHPEPAGTWSRKDAEPLHAKRTLTLLSTKYLEVEHAVWNILRQVALPDSWLGGLQEGAETLGLRAHLDRIAYQFVPEGFVPERFGKK